MQTSGDGCNQTSFYEVRVMYPNNSIFERISNEPETPVPPDLLCPNCQAVFQAKNEYGIGVPMGVGPIKGN